jgi:hypothetical protein
MRLCPYQPVLKREHTLLTGRIPELCQPMATSPSLHRLVYAAECLRQNSKRTDLGGLEIGSLLLAKTFVSLVTRRCHTMRQPWWCGH